MKGHNVNIEYRIAVRKNKTEGIMSYDYDNCYPQRIREEVRASGTTSNCVNVYSKFMRGSGFKDQDFYKAKINNSGLTPDRLLREHTKDYALWHGFATLIKYNILLQPVEVYHMPFEFCRLVDPENIDHVGQIAIYDDWDKIKKNRIDTSKIDFIDLYTEDHNIIDEQIARAGGFDKWKGHVKWHSADGIDYPLSIYDPVLEDVRTDSGIKTFRFKQVKSGFMASHMVILPFEFEGPDNGPNASYEEFPIDDIRNRHYARGNNEENEDRTNFLNSLKDFQGAENSNKLFVVENKGNGDAPIQIQKLDLQDGDKMFQITNQTVKDSIIESFSVPPILVGIQVPGKLGSSTDMADAYDYYNLVTSDERLIFEEEYKKIFSRFVISLNPTMDYSIIALEYSTGETPALIDTLGIGGTQALVGILEGTLSPAQKINTIVIVFGISRDDATSMVGGTINAG